MIRAAIKILLLILWSALWFIPVWVAKSFGRTALRDYFVRICSKGLIYIAGIRLRVTGQLSELRPLLVVSNHLSYVDVLILASHGALRFTPKSEIASWPVVGFICHLTDCVFINRRTDKIREGKDTLYAALAKGNVISLFPESTTGNGISLLPFRSSFFNLAEEPIEGRPLTVQPAAITFTRVRKLPIDSTQWPRLAWVGDVYLLPHLWEFLMMGPVEAELVFLPPVTAQEHGDRKRLAVHCQQVIAQTIESVKARRNHPIQNKK